MKLKLIKLHNLADEPVYVDIDKINSIKKVIIKEIERAKINGRFKGRKSVIVSEKIDDVIGKCPLILNVHVEDNSPLQQKGHEVKARFRYCHCELHLLQLQSNHHE